MTKTGKDHEQRSKPPTTEFQLIHGWTFEPLSAAHANRDCYGSAAEEDKGVMVIWNPGKRRQAGVVHAKASPNVCGHDDAGV